MSSPVEGAKGAVEKGKAAFAAARERYPWIEHLMQTVDRYNQRRGNLYAAGISFNGILALIPIIMVVFAIAAFVLASQPEWIARIQDEVVKAMPGELGDQVKSLIDSAINSRATVGVVGLLGAALTGVGWISLVRTGFTEMFGGRVERNAVMSKVSDLASFALLGIAFALTMALTALGNSSAFTKLFELVGLDDATWLPIVLRAVSIVVSVFATWLLFSFIFSRLPLVPLPFRNTLKAGLVTAIAFEIVKTLGGIYLKSVLSSPAGVAFGPILGIMVFAYLASRILLYACAWCATDPINADYQVVEDADADAEMKRPVVVSPNYEVHPTPRPGVLIGVAGIGAVLSALFAWLLRR